jgi:hypothetical protein
MVCSFGAGATFSFHVLGEDPGSWPAILSSIGLAEGSGGVVVAPAGTDAPAPEWIARVERGTILILEGESPLAVAFGFRSSSKPRIRATSVDDVHAPKLRIVWEKPIDLALFEIPPDAQIFARERWTHAPLIAGLRKGAGAVLWVAASPGPHGYDRFPYLIQALTDLGLEPPLRSGRLWAFFDSAYRTRVDLDYFASRWRAAGIGALHVAAWHDWERDAESDEYLRKLIDACHRNAISIYAWLELPHVSEKFWNEHPEWREKTALLQDAQLDWRKLMNLTNRDASRAVATGLRDLLSRFDWDGVNLAELYFESLEGIENPARFTPMNDDVRAQLRASAGFDPLDLFTAKNKSAMPQFLEFRAELARRAQQEWIAEIEQIRRAKPHLDLVLTHVDDRFDTSIREKIGADASRVLPLLSEHDFTFLIEDPATIWNLGPARYPQIAARYKPLTPAQDKLAIDINVVERYQDVYPTKQQTGVELFELVHVAAQTFPRVALYFENSILRQDWALLSSAAAAVDRVDQSAGKLVIDSRRGAGVAWKGAALVDGRVWPFTNDSTVWLPRGAHSVELSTARPPLRVLDFNGDLKSASATTEGVEFAYQSSARAFARVERMPRRVEIDGVETHLETAGDVLVLPRGQHIVTLIQ